MGIYSTVLPLPHALDADARSELIFRGVDQAGPSLEARVFLNNPNADETTPSEQEAGYAGSFHVYGLGEPLPPALADASIEREAGGPPVAPIEKRVPLDAAALGAASRQGSPLTVTVVAQAADPTAELPARLFEDVQLILGARPT